VLKEFDGARLRAVLFVFFFALALPAGFLIWQAYSQLKWEAFHQYRGLAEELSGRVDARLAALLRAEEARTFADYTFLVVSGDPSANLLQRSPLSTYPVPLEFPGLVGYFQVGTEGEFSTPLLPSGNSPPELYGISNDEYRGRRALAGEIQAVLSDNRLVEYSPADVDFDSVPGEEASRNVLAGGKQKSPPETRAAREQLAANLPAASDADVSAALSLPRGLSVRDYAAKPAAEPPRRQVLDSQLAFDKLNEEQPYASQGGEGADQADDEVTRTREKKERDNTLGRVADIKLDAAYQEKSAVLEQEQQRVRSETSQSVYAKRGTRKERISLPEPVVEEAGTRVEHFGDRADLRISTFESEIDPLEFSLLDSGHFVLFRKVWRDGERYIQGMLVDQRAFIHSAIDQPFRETTLASMSDLIFAYQDSVLHTATGDRYDGYGSRASELDGALLYRNRLSAPFNNLEVIYSVNQLPPGPGAGVLGWVSLSLALVLCGGFYALYRIGLSHISLARQQQDFVSAVSHELKTPLTSIRMYGEMLKEGWAADDKKQAYYEFIHDESERLTRLISNVLQLAKLTHSDPQLDIKPVVVGEIMATIESKITNQVQLAGFELLLERDPDADAAIVMIDEDCFAQIIINLVDNAIKFSGGAETKRIDISSHLASDNKVLFAVRDFGPGIPRDQMRKIFDMFYRSESELTRETVGTGIGLAIVHQLSVAMGAEVDVLNRDPGAEFRVSVSRSTPSAGVSLPKRPSAHEAVQNGQVFHQSLF
jgi:signal transduction histidine kinase